MLYLIGLGFDEKDISLKAIEAAKLCECYAELYTSKWKGSLENLKAILGKEIKLLKRSDLEENLHDFLNLARQRDVAIFVPGDPLAATTHIDILLEAKRHNMPVRIIHNASIFSAIGLQLYKYGKVATIPFSDKLDFVKNTIKANKEIGSHTLLLLDLDSELNLYMNVRDALRVLIKNKVLKMSDKVIAANIGGKVYYDDVKNLFEKEIETPSVLIIPGKLHFKEKEFLEELHG
jgi:diphthine synthase